MSGLILYTLFPSCSQVWWLGPLAGMSYVVLVLTHLGPSDACIHPSSAQANIGTDNGLFPIRRQARTNGGILLIETLGTNFNDIWIEMQTFYSRNAFKNVVCETAAILSHARCIKTWLCNE